MHYPQVRSNLRKGFIESLLSVPYVQIVQPTHFLIAAVATQHFHVSSGIFGAIVALPAWMNIVQLFFVPAFDGRVSARVLSLSAQLLDLLVWIFVVATLYWLPPIPTIAGIYFLVVFALSNTGRAVNRIAWISWAKEYVPGSVRNNYFARRAAAAKVVELAIIALVVPALARFTTVATYHHFLAVGVGLKTICLLLQITIRTPAVVPLSAPAVPARIYLPSRWPALFRQGGAFTTFAVLTAIQAAFDSVAGGFSHLYVFGPLGLSASTAGMFLLINTAVMAATLPAWGRFAVRFGTSRLLGICAVCIGLNRIAWALIHEGNVVWLYLVVAWQGLFSAGFGLALMTLRLRLLPLSRKETLLSFELALSSVLTGAAPLLFGQILDWHGGSALVYRVGFAVSALGSLGVGIYVIMKCANWEKPQPLAR